MTAIRIMLYIYSHFYWNSQDTSLLRVSIVLGGLIVIFYNVNLKSAFY